MEKSPWRKRNIALSSRLVDDVAQWHSGQGSATYALTSDAYVSLSMIDAAIEELSDELPGIKKASEKRALKAVIGDLVTVRTFPQEWIYDDLDDLRYDMRNYGHSAEEEAAKNRGLSGARRGHGGRGGRRGLGGVDRNVIDQWKQEPWRAPDSTDKESYAIWYGPGGPRGEHGLLVEEQSSGWKVTEFTAAAGNLEEPEADFMTVSTHIDRDDLIDALKTIGKTRQAYQIDMEPNTAGALRWAASLGVARIAYYGGEEGWEDQLPR